MGTNILKQEQLLKKYRDIEGDIANLLNSFSPGDSSALILDKISHLKQTLNELMDEFEQGSFEYTSIANQYAQTLRAAMDKGVDVVPEREASAGVDFESDDSDPLTEAEYRMAERQRMREQQQQTAATKTNFNLDPLYADLTGLDFGMRRSKNGLGGVRKIHFNHRPPTIFDDVWYGHNEVAMDALLGPKRADDMMVATHLALSNEVEKPEDVAQSNEVVAQIHHSENDALQNNLSHIVSAQQKRIDTPQSNIEPLQGTSRF